MVPVLDLFIMIILWRRISSVVQHFFDFGFIFVFWSMFNGDTLSIRLLRSLGHLNFPPISLILHLFAVVCCPRGKSFTLWKWLVVGTVEVIVGVAERGETLAQAILKQTEQMIDCRCWFANIWLCSNFRRSRMELCAGALILSSLVCAPRFYSARLCYYLIKTRLVCYPMTFMSSNWRNYWLISRVDVPDLKREIIRCTSVTLSQASWEDI